MGRKSREEKEQQRILLKEQEKQEKNKARKKVEELEKKAQTFVLTISASNYVGGKGKNLRDYDFRSLEVRGEDYIKGGSRENGWRVYISPRLRLMKQGMEIGAEVITDTRPSHHAYYARSELYLIGTALIQKDKE